VLILVFTQAAVASAVGDVEHLFVGNQAHQHMIFSDVTLDFHHDNRDGDGPHHDLGTKAPNHHHHHGDLGSSNFLHVTAPDTLAHRIGMSDPLSEDNGVAKTRLELPDRPPRTGQIAA
jgi:hypothetical protein